MKKLLTLTGFIALVTGLISCGGAKGNDPGRAYMPDMYYSRAYEAFGYNNLPEDHDLKSKGIYYNAQPVPGTIARGDAFSFPIPAGDSGYAMAATYRNATMDTTTLNPNQMIEAERLYLIYCGICHGTALDGNGPLWKGGDGPFPAAPRNLLDDYTKGISDGQMYHAITYGKGQMGSYASQVHPEQRWWLIKYMRSKQNGGAGGGTTTSAAAPANATGAVTSATDTTAN